MKIPSRQFIGVGLWVISVSCIGLSMYFMYQAGCVGDLKTGSLGNFSAALEVETNGVMLSWLGIVFATISLASRTGLVISQRIAVAVIALLVGLAVTTYWGLQFETWGVQHCFAEKPAFSK